MENDYLCVTWAPQYTHCAILNNFHSASMKATVETCALLAHFRAQFAQTKSAHAHARQLQKSCTFVHSLASSFRAFVVLFWLFTSVCELLSCPAGLVACLLRRMPSSPPRAVAARSFSNTLSVAPASPPPTTTSLPSSAWMDHRCPRRRRRSCAERPARLCVALPELKEDFSSACKYPSAVAALLFARGFLPP
jgi:hypothetical protein